MSLNGQSVKGVLLDITGVLVESSLEGDGRAIPGSIEAVTKLKDAGLPVRFVTNETQKTRRALVQKLHRLGYSMEEKDVFPPALAMASLIESKKLNPYLLVHPNCLDDLPQAKEGEAFDSVVLGDAVDGFSYQNVNKAFRIIMKTGGDLYSLGKGKYYQEDGDLTLDVGAFTAGLEFATGKSALICGKPSPDFFGSALADIGVSDAGSVVMVGDDVVSDVGGAQACGIKGVLVRTGKFRKTDENHPSVKPDKIVDNLAHFVDQLLS